MARARSRKGTGAAIAASILFHLALVAPLAILIPRLPTAKLAPNEPLEVQLSRSSPALESKAASPASAVTHPSVTPTAPPSAAAPTQRAQDHSAAPSATAAAAAAAAVGGGASAGLKSQPGSSGLEEGETAARVRQALRRLSGCETPGFASQAELQACRHDRAQQYAIGEAMRMDTLSSAKRADYDHARDVCDRVYHYSGLDSDSSHTDLPPQVYGNPC
ncbi:MAG: hypothetical protein ACYDD1_06705 [Caulobacteraceae bacterium]